MNQTESTTIKEFSGEQSLNNFAKYSNYSSVDVDWIEEIPQNWSTLKLRWACSFITDGSHHSPSEDENGDKIYITVSDIQDGEIDFDNAKRISNEDFEELEKGDCRPQKGDVLISKDGTIGKVAVVDNNDFVVLSSIGILRPSDNLNPHFLKYFAESKYSLEQMRSHLKGSAITRITLEIINDLNFILPPRDEQNKIVAFLDSEIETIDRLIEEKKKLIHLIEEKRRAVIKSAVIKGLNPDAEMKESGVDWLGQVPEHWDVPRIRFVARMESGHTPSKSEDEYWDGNIPWVSLADSGWMREHDYISETDKTISDEGLANSSAHVLPPETMVFTRDATVGLCAITTREMAVSQHIIGWICEDNLLPEYLLNVTKAMDQELDRLTMGATISTVGMEDIKKLKMPLPPIEEQEEIVEYLNEELKKFDESIEKIQQGIERLKEYRTALITEAVTGQIDVRGEV